MSQEEKVSNMATKTEDVTEVEQERRILIEMLRLLNSTADLRSLPNS